jgi:Icc protein
VSYPGNYTLITLYEGGYMVNLHRVASPLALRWIALSRHTYFGLVPEYLLGTLADRNHVVHRDFSGLR